MPFGFIKDLNSPNVVFNSDYQWYGETKQGVNQYIEILKKNSIDIMLKPQIWIAGGKYTGALKMKTEEEWQVLESSYLSFILTYAKIAEDAQVPIFCIGTELEKFVVNRPNYWKKLIAEVKKVYKGKLTYAANWDEYKRVSFWEQLDYIGVDAYFPISLKKTPSVKELQRGWQRWKNEIGVLSITKSKPVLFTEFGYRSIAYTANEPWKSDKNNKKPNFEAQVNATEAVFKEFWKEQWFAGGYIWKWFIDYENSGGEFDNRFTPQNKPVENTIRSYFKEYK